MPAPGPRSRGALGRPQSRPYRLIRPLPASFHRVVLATQKLGGITGRGTSVAPRRPARNPMIRLERHQLGPRVRVLGRRVHEWQLGVAVAGLAAGLRLASVVDSPGAALIALLACWLVIKDWHDLFPSRRDTASWRPLLHRRAAAL